MNLPRPHRPIFVVLVVAAVVVAILEAVNVFVQGDEPNPLIIVVALLVLLSAYFGLGRATEEEAGPNHPEPPAP